MSMGPAGPETKNGCAGEVQISPNKGDDFIVYCFLKCDILWWILTNVSKERGCAIFRTQDQEARGKKVVRAGLGP